MKRMLLAISIFKDAVVSIINCRTKWAFMLLALLISSYAVCAPSDTKGYEIYRGGLIDIQDGAYVEGSVKQGGIQPDYIVDLKNEPLKSIMAKAEAIQKLNIEVWEKIGMVTELVRQDVFHYTDYANPYYRRLLKKYRLAGQDIPLSEYATCRAGVCREHALILHFALKAAGIKNQFAYASVLRVQGFHQISEDHAFTVVRIKGVDWVIDAYNELFHGYRLQDLMSAGGPNAYAPMAPVAKPTSTIRFIKHMNDFPTVYNPIGKSCSSVFKE